MSPKYVLDLAKGTDAYMTGLRTKWKAAKEKHAAALAAKKITFGKDLGPMLDKRLALYKAFKSFKTGDFVVVARIQLNSLKSNGKDILSAANSYIAKVHGMGGPAETELTAILHTIAKDAGQYDIDYVAQKYESSAAAKAKEKAKLEAARKKAAKK
jgi:hypothetical protein